MALEMAVLKIKDRRNTSVAHYDASANNAPKKGMGNVNVSGYSSSIISNSSMLSDLTSAVSGALNDILGGSDGTDHSSDIVCAEKWFKVQFNPEQLSFSANSAGSFIKHEDRHNVSVGVAQEGQAGQNAPSTSKLEKNLDNQARTARIENETPKVYMSFKLIFDAVYQNDAFMHTSGIGENIMGGINALRGKKYSVQPYVEALIGAIRNSRTRDVTFSWGDMCYDGVLNSINSKYTMFNTSGSPVRAEVDITIVLVDDTIGDLSKNFQDAYKELINS